MIIDLRKSFNRDFTNARYTSLTNRLTSRCGTEVQFRVAETPIFLPRELLAEMADAGAALTRRLLGWPEYMQAARAAIPAEFHVAGESPHPHFLTADFALVQDPHPKHEGALVPRLVELQAFPSVYAYQEVLNEEYAAVFGLPDSLKVYLGDLDGKLDRQGFWNLLRQTILGKHPPEHVVLLEVDPFHQKTLPDFLLTARELGIAIVDITTVVAHGSRLYYPNAAGELVPIHRIYNRAIADEMAARAIKLQFDLTAPWDVEWAGHPNWYFLISKYSIPWLTLPEASPDVDAGPGAESFRRVKDVVPPAVFLQDFLVGPGFDRLRTAGVELPDGTEAGLVYEELLLKPLFSFAGKGIQFAPTRGELEAIPLEERGNYLLQQKMRFVPTIETPHGLTQAEIRILYVWPDGGQLTPMIALVRLGRGKMMGVDHNRDQQWVGGSAAFWV